MEEARVNYHFDDKLNKWMQKPDIKKSRVKSAVGSKVFDPRVLRTTHDDLAAQCTKQINFESILIF